MSDQSVSRGSLLLAPPASNDPNFRRSVVLVCEHTPEGSFGLILNRPLELQLSDVIEDEDLPFHQLTLGGPVQQNTLHYLHRLGESVSDAVAVVDGVFWGGNFDVLKLMLRTGEASTDDVRLFIGYAGWTAGQLEEEIRTDGWIVTEAHADFVFSDAADRLWRAVLRTMGGDFAAMANFPDDPRLN